MRQFIKAIFSGISSLLIIATLITAPASLLADSKTTTATPLQVLSSPTCGCCSKWVEHLQSNGFDAQIEHPADLNQEKATLGIKPQYQSCHTGVSQEGFVFEGHI